MIYHLVKLEVVYLDFAKQVQGGNILVFSSNIKSAISKKKQFVILILDYVAKKIVLTSSSDFNKCWISFFPFAQCENCRKLLSTLFHKNCVKLTYITYLFYIYKLISRNIFVQVSRFSTLCVNV